MVYSSIVAGLAMAAQRGLPLAQQVYASIVAYLVL